jgi:hypothetical protein
MNTSNLREQVLEENNGQTIFIGLLNQLNSVDVQEIRISEVLSGDIDFSILQDRGFKNVKSIIVEKEGQITNLLNIPETVEKVECTNQLLVELKGLPVALEDLSLDHNNITKFDCGSLPKLKTLNLSNNELIDLKNLPETLEKLECENNQLRELNLANCPRLQEIICSNNPILVLQNVPPSVSKLEMENNPFIQIEETTGEEGAKKLKKKLDYLESINKYFKLKTDYETKFRKLKRQAYDKGVSKKDSQRRTQSIRGSCIHCKRNVNTIFKIVDNRYIAVCGDMTKPCDLNIKLFKGEFYDFHEILTIYSGELQDEKQKMIVSKMDSIFKYISDQNATKQFEDNMKNYQESSTSYKDVESDYNNIFDNIENKQQVFRKKDQIFQIMESLHMLKEEYEKTGNRKLLTSMVELYNRDLEPAFSNLRMLKYSHNYVDIDDSGVGIPITSLKQIEICPHKKDYIYGEPPKVESFICDNI